MNQQTTNLRHLLLEIIRKESSKISPPLGPQGLQQNTVLNTMRQQLGITHGGVAALETWYDLFREGYLCWGLDLFTTEAPWFHVTDKGKRSLEQISRDPANPQGYLAFLTTRTRLNPIAKSYITEAINTYTAMCYKASAVMIGAASESLILELRDTLETRLKSIEVPIPKDLGHWVITRVLDALAGALDQRKKTMPHTLSESYEAHWPAFTQQIRAARNKVGHPSSVEPITPETVHANLLIFPELASLAEHLREWIENDQYWQTTP